MNTNTKKEMMQRIEKNIRQHGYHIYIVAGMDATPRFAYTIGLSSDIGAEIVLAGASFYSNNDVCTIIEKVAENLCTGVDWQKTLIEIASLGSFLLRKVDHSWVNMLLLGALDYYKNEITALQIIPDQLHMTVDVPNLSSHWNPATEPVWQWLSEPWSFLIPENSIGITNIAALRGEIITEVMRWEELEWELFAGAGPDVSQEDFRKVPLGTLLAIDKSLHIITNLDVGKGLWRKHGDFDWHSWEPR